MFFRTSFLFRLEVNDIKQDLLINEQIRFKEVQVIDDEGNKLDKMSINDAMNLAMDKNLDLVLVSSNPTNPVCKLMDYGKYKENEKTLFVLSLFLFDRKIYGVY